MSSAPSVTPRHRPSPSAASASFTFATGSAPSLLAQNASAAHSPRNFFPTASNHAPYRESEQMPDWQTPSSVTDVGWVGKIWR
jgi:hypothetical protein